MKKPIVDNLFALSSSMVFHLAILAAFVIGLGFTSKPEKLGNNKKVNIVHATALDEQQVKQEMNKLALADKNKRDQELARKHYSLLLMHSLLPLMCVHSYSSGAKSLDSPQV